MGTLDTTGGPRARPAHAAYAAHLLFGIVMALLGAILPQLSARLGIGLAQAGTLFLLLNGCILAVSLVLGLLIDRFGAKPPLAIGPLVTAFGLVAVALAAGYPALAWGVVLLGLGGGALNGSANTLVADLHPTQKTRSAALNRLGVFYGIGALFVPLALGLLLDRASLGAILLAGAVLCLAAGAHNALAALPPAKHDRRPAARALLPLLRESVVRRYALLLFFQAGNEFIAGGFVAAFLVRELDFSIRDAAWVLSGYWAALMLSRVAIGRLALRIDGPRLIALSALAAAAGTALFALATGKAAAVLAVAWIGAALAGIFPTALGVVAARHPGETGTVIGVLLTAALAGGMLLPWLTGVVGEAHGLRPALLVVAVQFLAIAGLAPLARRGDAS